MAKDCWDKADVIGKYFIPVAVAGTVLGWNVEATKRTTATQMVGIATAILSQAPENETPDALRDWAVDVLGSPTDPPVLSSAAMAQLKAKGIPYWDLSALKGENLKLLEENTSKFPVSPLETNPPVMP